MKKYFLLFLLTTQTHATNLIQVFHQALIHDPLFHQVIYQHLANHQMIPMQFSSLLPTITINAQPQLQTTHYSGPAYTGATIVGRHGYDLNLSITQPIFNYANITKYNTSIIVAKQSDANFNAAIQDLIIRVARIYCAILLDQERVCYLSHIKKIYQQELNQVTAQYKIGLKTITDVYLVKASLHSTEINYLVNQTKLMNDREILRTITGISYTSLATLEERFPFITPKPLDINQWIRIAKQQNWSIKSAQYTVDIARNTIKQQLANNLPTINLETILDKNYYAFSGDSLTSFPGGGKITNKTLNLNLTMPIFQGGYTLAATQQSKYQYYLATEKLLHTINDTISHTYQNYNNILTSIEKIKIDRLLLQAHQHSLTGLQLGYRSGTQTLINVLEEQQKLFITKMQYAADRYAYVDNLLMLKQAAGILSPMDLMAINQWLQNHDR